jgi:hypothetical protein
MSRKKFFFAISLSSIIGESVQFRLHVKNETMGKTLTHIFLPQKSKPKFFFAPRLRSQDRKVNNSDEEEEKCLFYVDGNLISNWTNKVSDAIYIFNPQN